MVYEVDSINYYNYSEDDIIGSVKVNGKSMPVTKRSAKSIER